MINKSRLIFMWENIGPYHGDRIEAVNRDLGGYVIASVIQIGGSSHGYLWCDQSSRSFEIQTLFPDAAINEKSGYEIFYRLALSCIKSHGEIFFFCHPERYPIFLTALLLRITGNKIIVMTDSKLDDKPRFLWKELAKAIFYLPYNAVFVSSIRSQEYMKFMGFKDKDIVRGYDKLSIDRIRLLSPTPPAPNGIAFSERHFTILSRLIKKKNLLRTIQAFSIYANQNTNPRKLLLCGYGEEEELLRQEVRLLELDDLVFFTGHLDQENVSRVLAASLSLLFVSEEEQYGLVAIEALAMGVPVIYSPNCGSGDDLLRSGINGYLVEPDNLDGIASFMTKISEDELLWRKMSINALDYAKLGDVTYFSRGVRKLIDKFE